MMTWMKRLLPLTALVIALGCFTVAYCSACNGKAETTTPLKQTLQHTEAIICADLDFTEQLATAVATRAAATPAHIRALHATFATIRIACQFVPAMPTATIVTPAPILTPTSPAPSD